MPSPWRGNGKKCARCETFPCNYGTRFCLKCGELVRNAMEKEGYLEDEPYKNTYRSGGQKENRKETRDGVDS